MARSRLKEVINSTGRRIIRERDVSLTVVADPPTVRLVEIKLPQLDNDFLGWESATVFVEASQARTASFDRYSVGSVADISTKKPINLRTLRNFADASDAIFAIKIVSSDGKILASADDVRPNERRSADQEALLQVKARPMGELPWIVEFAASWQTFLVVNNRIISDADTWIEQNPIGSALVLPAALRVVLRKLVENEEFRISEWGMAWADWAALRAPSPMPEVAEVEDDTDDPEEWVEQVVGTFCEGHQTVTRLKAALEPMGTEQ